MITTKLPTLPRNSDFHGLLRIKLSTYPPTSSIGKRPKLRIQGFSSTTPTTSEVAQLAKHYDLWLLDAKRANLIPIIKKTNPNVGVLLYFASSLSTPAWDIDAGSVDSQNAKWIVKNHANWLLKGADKKPIAGRSWNKRDGEPKYWADPGNAEWQAFFVQKLNTLLSRAPWDGVILDEFLAGRASHTHEWAGSANQQVNYSTDKLWQAAQLKFLRGVCPKVKVPIAPNVEVIALNPYSPAFSRSWFGAIQQAAGGAEVEGFALSSGDETGYIEPETVAEYIRAAQATPAGKTILFGTPTGPIEGHVGRTIYAYCLYLLASRPTTYWTFKEGYSDLPHFWYKEFDIDTGKPLGEMTTTGSVWVRDFTNATVVVNPSRTTAVYKSTKVNAHTGMILEKR